PERDPLDVRVATTATSGLHRLGVEARVDVHADWHAQVLAGRPEALVVGAAPGNVLGRSDPDRHRLQPGLLGARDFFDRVVDVPQSDLRLAPESCWLVGAELG